MVAAGVDVEKTTLTSMYAYGKLTLSNLDDTEIHKGERKEVNMPAPLLNSLVVS